MNTLNRIKKTPLWKLIVQYTLIVIGIILYCFAWSVFLVPKHIIGGGVVGLASIIYYLTGIPMGISNFVINALLLLMGCKVLGKMFGINTIIGITTASLSLLFFQQVLHIDTLPSFQFENMELVTRAILGGALSGIGIGLCLANGGSSGGSDIIALIITKYRNVSPGSVILIADAVVIISTIFIPNSLGLEGMVYCYIVLGVYAYSIDLVVEGRKQTYQIMERLKTLIPILDATPGEDLPAPEDTTVAAALASDETFAEDSSEAQEETEVEEAVAESEEKESEEPQEAEPEKAKEAKEEEIQTASEEVQDVEADEAQREEASETEVEEVTKSEADSKEVISPDDTSADESENNEVAEDAEENAEEGIGEETADITEETAQETAEEASEAEENIVDEIIEETIEETTECVESSEEAQTAEEDHLHVIEPVPDEELEKTLAQATQMFMENSNVEVIPRTLPSPVPLQES